MYENTIVSYVYSYSVSSSLTDDRRNINLLCCFSFPPLPVVTSYFMYNRKIKYNCNTAIPRGVQSNYTSACCVHNYELSITRSIIPEA